MSGRYYRVEVLCEILDLPRARLRRYEQLGLIAPSGEPDDSSNTRRYTEDDLRRVRRIRRLQRDLGLDPAGLQVAMRLLDQIAELQRQLEGRR